MHDLHPLLLILLLRSSSINTTSMINMSEIWNHLTLNKSKHANETDYCKLTCENNDTPNVACNCSSSPECTDISSRMDVFRKWIIEVHNDVRQHVASGREKKGGLHHEVANMNTINYDLELEHLSKCYARKCRHKSPTECRRGVKWNESGLNHYYGSTYLRNERSLKEGVISWYHEVDLLQPNAIDTMVQGFDPNKEKATRRLSQLLWAKTTHVGCWRAWNIYHSMSNLICLYGVKGNIPGQPIFRWGESCSECGEKECNDRWISLCGTVDIKDAEYSPLEDDSSAPGQDCFRFSLWIIVAISGFAML